VVATVAVACVLLASCSSGSDDETQAASGTLQSAARQYADAFLHGSPEEVTAAFGSSCESSSTSSGSQATEELQRLRSSMVQIFGRPLDEVKVVRVEVRDATNEAGDAQAVFNLPPRLAGNDNWVRYRVEGGRWRVANCHLPIGGSSKSASSSASSSTVPSPPAVDSESTESLAPGDNIYCDFDSKGVANAHNPRECSEPDAADRYPNIVCSVEAGGELTEANAPECFPS
jgi:hypothetical protein